MGKKDDGEIKVVDFYEDSFKEDKSIAITMKKKNMRVTQSCLGSEQDLTVSNLFE
jgi:hypothetical protein